MPERTVFRRIDERFDEIRRIVAEQMEKDRRTLAGSLVQGFRRLRGYRNEDEWVAALLDACAPFCSRCALFVLNTGKLEWKAARGLEAVEGPQTPSFDISAAAAFQAAIDTREVTVTLCTAREISPQLTHALGEEPQRKALLVPVATSNRVAAILYAEDADPEGLELVCGIAALALELATSGGAKPPQTLLHITPAAAPAPQDSPAAAVTLEDEVVRLRAQRFARKLTAEIRLHESGAVKAGRAAGRLYEGALRVRIDIARDAYRNQFGAGPSIGMPDYLHEELVRVLASGDAALMGMQYPGPMQTTTVVEVE